MGCYDPWAMRLRLLIALACLGGLVLVTLLSCGSLDEPLAAGALQLASIGERASEHRGLLTARLQARDDLGPGEYRDRLHALHAELWRALDLEEESRSAALVAQFAELIDSAGERARQVVGARVPASLVPWLSLPPVSLTRAALEHASRSASAAVALRAHAAENAPGLADLRERILDTRTRLARARLLVAEAMAALGPPGSAHAAELVPVARRHRVRVNEVKALHNIGDLRMTRATLALQVEARGARELAAFTRELADRAGLRIDAVELQRVSGAASATLRVTLRRARAGTQPLRLHEPTSTLAELERQLADATSWREALTDALVPEPGPSIALDAITSALPAGADLERFAAADGRFATVVRARGGAGRAFLQAVQTQRRLELLTPATGPGRVGLRGQYRASASPLAASALDTPLPAAPQARPSPRPKQALFVGNEVRAATSTSEPGWRLVGVASAGKGEVHALLRDGSGKPHIVKVGSRLDDGAKVLSIARDSVTTRLGASVRHIRAAE